MLARTLKKQEFTDSFINIPFPVYSSHRYLLLSSALQYQSAEINKKAVVACRFHTLPTLKHAGAFSSLLLILF